MRDNLGITRYAPLFYAGPGQINYLLPSGTATGTARVLVTTGLGEAITGTVEVASIAPALFTANASGNGVVAGFALRSGSDGRSSTIPLYAWDGLLKRFIPTPLDPGTGTDTTYLVLFGTGLRYRSGLANVQATAGGLPCQVEFIGAQPDYVGLDQVNLRLPASLATLAGRGEVPIQLVVDGKSANPVTISVK